MIEFLPNKKTIIKKRSMNTCIINRTRYFGTEYSKFKNLNCVKATDENFSNLRTHQKCLI